MDGELVAPEGAFLLAVTGSAVPVLAWLWFFYRRDRYDREPKWLIVQLFAIGALPVGIVAGLVNAAAAAVAGLIVTVVLVAPVGEEILKYLGMRVRTRRSHHFDEPVDGMIYGTTVGLGFAFAENIDYLFMGYAGIPFDEDILLCEPGFECFLVLAIVRGLLTALVHALATGIAGYYLAQRVLGGRSGSVERKGLAYAIALHACWNGGDILFPGLDMIALVVACVAYFRLARRALAASPHRVEQLDDNRHRIEHFAAGDGALQPCPTCQFLHPATDSSCGVCGTRLLDPRARHARPCEACGQVQSVTSKFCANCGTAMPEPRG